MKELIIKENEAGQRFDKYLAKVLKEAPKSFFYKMLRKKNITLNGKKATGMKSSWREILLNFFSVMKPLRNLQEIPMCPEPIDIWM